MAVEIVNDADVVGTPIWAPAPARYRPERALSVYRTSHIGATLPL
jgi:hypothetical protein